MQKILISSLIIAFCVLLGNTECLAQRVGKRNIMSNNKNSKQMKKALTIFAVAVAMLATANAQTGLNIGYTPQTITSSNGNWHDTIRLDGVAIGINHNIQLSGDLALSVGLQGRYGFASSETTVDLGLLGSAKATASHKHLLVDVPVLLNYGFNLGSARLTLFAGPTISFALMGKTTWSGNANVLGALNLGTDGEDDWYDDDSNNSRFDLGATLGACISFNQFRIYGGYNLGLLNLSTADNTTRKAAGFFAGIGYAL